MESSGSSSARSVPALLALTAFLLLWNLGLDPRGRISEERCVKVASAIVASGNWLVPMLDGVPRLQKPPLFYWLASANGALHGGVTPGTTRAVSAFAGIALVALVTAFAARLGGAQLGLLAGALLPACVQFITSARRGDAELLFALLSWTALYALERAWTTRASGWVYTAGAALGLAFLAKATAVLLVIALPAALFLADRRALRVLVRRDVVLALALAAALGLAWYAAILATVPDALATLLGDAVQPLGAAAADGDSKHYRPFYWYLGVLPARAAPAGLLLPLLAWRLWRTRLHAGDASLRFVALAFVGMFAGFSLLPQKQDHYVLPLLPAFALLTAEALIAAAREAPLALARCVRTLGTPLALAGAALAALLGLALAGIGAVPDWLALSLGAVVAARFALAALEASRARAREFAYAFLPALLLTLALERGGLSPRREALANAPLAARADALRFAAGWPRVAALFRIDELDPNSD